MRQFRLKILRLHQLHRMRRQISGKCQELRLRFHIICILEQLKQVIISIVIANFIRMWTTRREDCNFAKFAVPRHQFFKLDRASMCQSRGRDTTCLVSAGHSKVYRSLNIPDVGFVVQWDTPHRCYLEIRYLAVE